MWGEAILGVLAITAGTLGFLFPPFFGVCIVLAIILLGSAVAYNYFFGGYNFDVEIYQKYGDTPVKLFDKAKKMRDKNGYRFKLQKRKDELSPPRNTTMMINEKGKTVITLVSTAPGSYFYAEVKADGGIEALDNAKDQFWRSTENQKDLIKYQGKGFWEKYAWIAAIGIIFLGSGFFFYMLGGSLEHVSNGLAGASGAIEKATENLKDLKADIKAEVLEDLKAESEKSPIQAQPPPF